MTVIFYWGEWHKERAYVYGTFFTSYFTAMLFVRLQRLSKPIRWVGFQFSNRDYNVWLDCLLSLCDLLMRCINDKYDYNTASRVFIFVMSKTSDITLMPPQSLQNYRTPWASCQIGNIAVAHAPRMPGTFPRNGGLAIPTCIMARAWRTCGDR